MCHLTGALGWFPTLLSSATALHNVDMFIVNKERCLHDLCALAIFWMWQTKESDVRERSVYTAQISSLQADNGLKRWCLSYLWACTDQSHCSGWIQWPWRHARSYFPTFKSSSGLTPKLSPLALWTWQDNESVSMTHICSEHALQSQICWRVTRRLKKKKPNLIAERIPANTEANSYFTHQKTASENWIKCPQNPQNPHKRLLPL